MVVLQNTLKSSLDGNEIKQVILFIFLNVHDYIFLNFFKFILIGGYFTIL